MAIDKNPQSAKSGAKTGQVPAVQTEGDGSCSHGTAEQQDPRRRADDGLAETGPRSVIRLDGAWYRRFSGAKARAVEQPLDPDG